MSVSWGEPEEIHPWVTHMRPKFLIPWRKRNPSSKDLGISHPTWMVWDSQVNMVSHDSALTPSWLASPKGIEWPSTNVWKRGSLSRTQCYVLYYANHGNSSTSGVIQLYFCENRSTRTVSSEPLRVVIRFGTTAVALSLVSTGHIRSMINTTHLGGVLLQIIAWNYCYRPAICIARTDLISCNWMRDL